MKNKKNIIIGSALVSIFVITGVYYCTKTYSQKINVVSYKEPAQINESGYQITKYENLDAYDWIDDDNVLVLKNNDSYNDEDSLNSITCMSIYNLDTKTYKDFDNMNMGGNSYYGVSPSGRYVLYGEPRYIPEVGSDEWKKACDSQELFHEKHDIIDLTTGYIIEDFDKVINNCSADYRWISDDKIFVNYGGEWGILNKDGKSLKRGYFNFDNCYSSYVQITGIDDIKDLGDDCDGKFYYTKDFMGSDRNVGINIYSMDINSLKEEFIYKCEDSFESDKKGKNIVMECCFNNGQANEDGVYEHRTFGYKIVDEEGKEIQKIELSEGRFTNLIKMSPHGTKAVFKDELHVFPKERETADVSDDCIKLINISNGDIKEIGKISDLMDENNEERFYNNDKGDIIGMTINTKVPGPRFGRISWDKSGTSLFFTYRYTSKKDGKNYTDTYVVTFDNKN